MSRFFHRLRELRNVLYTRYLGATNVCTTCGLLCLGDVLIQGAEVTWYKWKNPGVKSSPGGHETEVDYDRTARIFQVGIPYGIAQHHWYKHLDRWFPGKARGLVFRKVIVDTAIAGPAFICLYFYGMALTEKKGLKGSWDAMAEVFVPVYMADIVYWPIAQAVNFYFVPNRYRVLVISICALFWNTFLSFVQHLENDPEEDPLHLSIDQHHLHDDALAHADNNAIVKPKDSETKPKVEKKDSDAKKERLTLPQRATVSASSPN